MPKPEFPNNIIKQNEIKYIGNYTCDHFILYNDNNEVHFYQDQKLNSIIKFIYIVVIRVEEYENNVPIISYTLSNIILDDIDENIFEIKEYGYTHKKCEYDKLGFPFLDVLSYYVSF